MARSYATSSSYPNGNPRGNSQLPANIKCSICERVKTTASFSAVKQNELRSIIRFEGSAAVAPGARGRVKCITCTGTQAVQKTCWDCDKTKSIEKFNQTQRKRDEGYCMRCGDIRANIPAREESSDEGSDSDSGNDSSDSERGLSKATGQLSIGASNGMLGDDGGVPLGSSAWNSPAPSTTGTSTLFNNPPSPPPARKAYKSNGKVSSSTTSSPASTKKENTNPRSFAKPPQVALESIPNTKNHNNDTHADTYNLDDVQVESDDSDSD